MDCIQNGSLRFGHPFLLTRGSLIPHSVAVEWGFCHGANGMDLDGDIKTLTTVSLLPHRPPGGVAVSIQAES